MNKILPTFLLLFLFIMETNAQQPTNPDLTRIKNEYNAKIKPKMPLNCVCHTANINPPDLSIPKNIIANKEKILTILEGKSKITMKTMGAEPSPEFLEILKNWLLSIKK